MKAKEKIRTFPGPPRPTPRYWEPALDWAYAHYPELAKRYPNQWVAFGRRCVLAHGNNLVHVLNLASRKIRWRDIPHMFVEQGIHVYAA